MTTMIETFKPARQLVQFTTHDGQRVLLQARDVAVIAEEDDDLTTVTMTTGNRFILAATYQEVLNSITKEIEQ